MKKWLALKNAVCFLSSSVQHGLSGARVLGDGLRALADTGVLGELTGQQQTRGGLDVVATSASRALVVVRGETGHDGGDALERCRERTNE